MVEISKKRFTLTACLLQDDKRESLERAGFELVSRYFDVSVKVSSEKGEPS